MFESFSSKSLLPAIFGVSVMVLTILAPGVIASAGADEAQILRVEGDVQAPVKLHAAAPSYPPAAKQEKAEGVVILEVVIDRQGEVGEIRVLQSPREDFSEAARDAVSQWRFQPASLNGDAIDVYYNLTINFKLG